MGFQPQLSAHEFNHNGVYRISTFWACEPSDVNNQSFQEPMSTSYYLPSGDPMVGGPMLYPIHSPSIYPSPPPRIADCRPVYDDCLLCVPTIHSPSPPLQVANHECPPSQLTISYPNTIIVDGIMEIAGSEEAEEPCNFLRTQNSKDAVEELEFPSLNNPPPQFSHEYFGVTNSDR